MKNYSDPCRDYASEARDDHDERRISRTVEPPPLELYKPFRSSSHSWKYRTAMGDSPTYHGEQSAVKFAAEDKAHDEQQCRDPKASPILTWQMRRKLGIYPDGMGPQDDPWIFDHAEEVTITIS